VVDGVNVAHTVFDDVAEFLKALVGAHTGNGGPVDKDVALSEEFEGFEGGAIGAKEALASFLEAFFVVDKTADLDDVAGHVVFEDFDGLQTSWLM
jgi:hypothetical protein